MIRLFSGSFEGAFYVRETPLLADSSARSLRRNLSDEQTVVSERLRILDEVNSFVGGRLPLGPVLLAEQQRPRRLIVGPYGRTGKEFGVTVESQD